MTASTESSGSSIDDLRSALDDGHFVVLTSGADALGARPLTLLEVDTHGNLLFLVDIAEPWVAALASHAAVNVAADRHADGRWVTVAGTATVGQDRSTIDRLWTPAAKAFWDTKDDPSIAVLSVRPSSADIWESHSSAIGRFFAIGKAALGGSGEDIGEHRTLAFAA
ncbi:MAG: hypothetical protein JWM34_5003 [Ilumatobacteraceae bacterium]|nr:hypothetical protein [Ilumatobacteraceae bacterium]